MIDVRLMVTRMVLIWVVDDNYGGCNGGIRVVLGCSEDDGYVGG